MNLLPRKQKRLQKAGTQNALQRRGKPDPILLPDPSRKRGNKALLALLLAVFLGFGLMLFYSVVVSPTPRPGAATTSQPFAPDSLLPDETDILSVQMALQQLEAVNQQLERIEREAVESGVYTAIDQRRQALQVRKEELQTYVDSQMAHTEAMRQASANGVQAARDLAQINVQNARDLAQVRAEAQDAHLTYLKELQRLEEEARQAEQHQIRLRLIDYGLTTVLAIVAFCFVGVVVYVVVNRPRKVVVSQPASRPRRQPALPHPAPQPAYLRPHRDNGSAAPARPDSPTPSPSPAVTVDMNELMAQFVEAMQSSQIQPVPNGAPEGNSAVPNNSEPFGTDQPLPRFDRNRPPTRRERAYIWELKQQGISITQAAIHCYSKNGERQGKKQTEWVKAVYENGV